MKSLVQQLALVSDEITVSMETVTMVSAALQRQIVRDFEPVWGIEATISPYFGLESVPLGAWPIIVTGEPLDGAGGIHNEKANGQPFALVEAGTSWSLAASHECLEMLVDPGGRKVNTGPSPKPDQGEVEFLVEVCDPCEAARYAYSIHGVLVSDFYTPRYFDRGQIAGALYSFHRSIEAPRQVLQGGYLSWHDPESDHWFQARWFGGEGVQLVDLGQITDDGRSFRAQIDEKTPEYREISRVPAHAASMTAARAAGDVEARASAARAARLRAQVAEIKRAGTRTGVRGGEIGEGKTHAA